MDPQRIRQAYDKLRETRAQLEILDDKLTFKVRNRAGSTTRGNVEQMEDRLRDVAAFVLDLKEVVDGLCGAIDGLFLGLANKPTPPPGPSGSQIPS